MDDLEAAPQEVFPRYPRHDFHAGHARPRVSVVIPARNEARNLPWVLDRMPAIIDEVILVDGHSTDDTVAVAHAHWPGITVIPQGASGKGAALVTGMLAATGDIVIMMDADGSMDPIEVHGLVGALMSGADVAKSSRYITGGGSHDISRLRNAGNRALTWTARFMFRHGWSELCYGLAAFWSDTLPRLGLDHILEDGDPGDRNRYGRGFEIETLLFTRAHRLGMKVAEVPSFEYPRVHGDSNLQTFPDGWRVVSALVKERMLHPHHAPRVHPHARAAATGVPVTVAEPVARDEVAVVITTHDMRRWPLLEKAYASVLAQTQPPDHLMVVVDRNDALAERARNALTDATVMSNTHAGGLSGARNTALEALPGSARIVAFLDDDAEASPDWLARLVEPLQPGANPGVLITSGWADPVWPGGSPPTWFPGTFNWVVGCSWTGLPTVPADIRNPLGATMAFRREVFESVGGFPEDMGRIGNHPVGCEETELAIRARQAMPHTRVLHIPGARVTQVVPPERARWSYFARRCYAEGQSKAVVSARVGVTDGLSSEREHMKRLLHETGRDIGSGAMSRGASIVAGLAITATGFFSGSLMRQRRSTQERARRSW